MTHNGNILGTANVAPDYGIARIYNIRPVLVSPW